MWYGTHDGFLVYTDFEAFKYSYLIDTFKLSDMVFKMWYKDSSDIIIPGNTTLQIKGSDVNYPSGKFLYSSELEDLFANTTPYYENSQITSDMLVKTLDANDIDTFKTVSLDIKVLG